MKPIKKKGNVKGTVLFTVVAVMMIMVVFLMSTLILTTSAQRRSYYTYYQTQAQYAAQAAIDAISNYAYNYSEVQAGQTVFPFYEWVTTSVDVTPQPITVEFPDSTLRVSNGEINCVVQKIPEGTYFWDGDAQRVEHRDSWKITATAVVGSGRDQAEYQVCNYIYDSQVTYEAEDTTVNAADWRTHSYSWTSSPGVPIATPNGSPNISKAIYQLSGIGAANNGNDNLISLGPLYAGLGNAPAGRTQYADRDNNIQNSGSSVGDVILVGSTECNANGKEFIFEHPGEGMSVYGNLTFKNSGQNIYANYQLPASENYLYEDLNYVYVDGCFEQTSNWTHVGQDNNGNSYAPVNLYAGSIKATANFAIHGDVYLYESAAGAGDSIIGRDGSSSNLTAFTMNNVLKANYSTRGYDGGDLISANNSLTLEVANGGGLQVGGDLIFTNPKGTLHIKKDVQVAGSLVCAGNLVIENGANLNVRGNAYYDEAKASIGGNFNARAKNAEGTVETYAMGTKTVSTLANIQDFVLSKYPNVANSDYKTLMSSKGLMGTEIDLSYFPYEYRQDEICEKYYRWDIKQTTDMDAAALVSNGGANSTDYRIYESWVAGHTWQYERVNSASGTWYVPYTTPHDPQNNHAFVTSPPVGLDKSGLKPSTATTIGDYWNDTAQMKSYLTNLGVTLADFTNTAPTRVGTVDFMSHDKNGGAKAFTLTNPYLITDSCEIDCSKLQANQPIFVDPTSKNHTASNPLYIFLKGSYQDANLLQIVVNNTGKYSAGNYTTYQGYDVLGSCAGHGEIIIMLEDTFKSTALGVISTGAYAQFNSGNSVTGKDNNRGDFDAVSSPIYPSSTQWAGITDPKDKYKYELVSNAVVFGQQGKTYKFNHFGFFNAEVVMPDSIIECDTTTYKAKAVYREFNESTPYSPSQEYVVNCLGTMFCKQFIGANMSECIYLADQYHGTTTITPVYSAVDSTNTDGKKADPNTVNNGNNLTNHYVGAN